MFMIKNSLGGSLPLQLEKGNVILTHGQSFDLDKYCSRKWIANNTELNYLIRKGHIKVVHDDKQVIPAQTVKPIKEVKVTKQIKKEEIKKVKQPEIIDLTQPTGSVTVVDFSESVKKEEVKVEKEEVKVEKEEVATVEEPKKSRKWRKKNKRFNSESDSEDVA